MKFFKIVFVVLAILMLTKLALAFEFERQIDEITKNPENTTQCIGISTNRFSYSDDMINEYFYYICRLSPDIKSFAYYYDKDNKKILNQITLPINFESLQLASPKRCRIKKKNNKFEESCSVFISSGLFDTEDEEVMFNMPTVISENYKK